MLWRLNDNMHPSLNHAPPHYPSIVLNEYVSVSSVSFHLFLVCTCEVNLVLVSSLHPVDIV